jgi:ubiquinone/menaquinone biosynthesis C-methylase UbiE
MRTDRDLYETRKLEEGYPNLSQLAHAAFSDTVRSRSDDLSRMERLVSYLGRITDLETSRQILVLGCGPHPEPMLHLAKMGHSVTGVEPVRSFVETAREFVGSAGSVIEGAAERMEIPDGSQDIVFFEAVLEHVDSIQLSLSEIHRVLKPGGLLYLNTTNRHRFSFSGANGEYNVPFYNWFPALVKESYVFEHLHYNPALANYTTRPAVHWFSFSELCSYGRSAGFARFYGITDLVRQSDPSIAKSAIRRAMLPLIQRNPWIRALALSQVGHWIAMLKRK